jgi:chromosomal replication initiation ATPase DnaA
MDPLAIQLVRAKAASDPAFRRAMEVRLHNVQRAEQPCIPLVEKAVEKAPRETYTERDWLFVSLKKTLADIATEVCLKYEISLTKMRCPRRDPHLVNARAEFYWRARNETNKSLPQIGRFARRDHSTVLNGIRRYDACRHLEAAE